MYRYLRDRRGRTERVDRYSRGRWRRRWPRSRAGRWLLWLLILVVVLIILDQLFGGFQKGTKVGGVGGLRIVVTSTRLLPARCHNDPGAEPAGHGAIRARASRARGQPGTERSGHGALCHSSGMTVFDDLEAEQERLEGILLGLSEADWLSESGAAGWTVADVVLHLAQSEEGVVASVSGADLRKTIAAETGNTVNDRADELVQAERAAPGVVFARWRQARRAAMEALRAADPQQAVTWVTGPVKPPTLATTRLAEHWAHGLDITEPLGIGFPDTGRLRHIAWLAHRTLPYALTMAGDQPADVRCEVTAPGNNETWTFGPENAASKITGPAGEFCRVAAQRLNADAAAGLRTTGPHGATALRVLRTYAV